MNIVEEQERPLKGSTVSNAFGTEEEESEIEYTHSDDVPSLSSPSPNPAALPSLR